MQTFSLEILLVLVVAIVMQFHHQFEGSFIDIVCYVFQDVPHFQTNIIRARSIKSRSASEPTVPTDR